MMINFNYVNSLDHSWKLGSSTWLLMYWLRSSLQSIMCVISHMVQDQYSCLPFFPFSFSALLVLSRASDLHVSSCVQSLAFIVHDCANSSYHLVPPLDMDMDAPLSPQKNIYPSQYFIANALSPWKWKLLGLYAVTFLTSWCGVFAWCIAIWWFWNDIWIKTMREYAQGSQPEWLHMQVGGSFERAT